MFKVTDTLKEVKMIKRYLIKIDIDEDFCESDLEECLFSGIINVGNHDLINIEKITEI